MPLPPEAAAMGHDRFVRGGPLVEDDTRHPMAAEVTDTGILARGLWGQDEQDRPTHDPERAADFQDPDAAAGRRPGTAGRSRRDPEQRPIRSPKPFRGRYIRAVPAAGTLRDLAWAPTVRAAASRQRVRSSGRLELRPEVDDLRRKQRVVNPGRLLLFVVDISGSMGGKLTALARDVALAVLRDAYLARDRVAMIAFRQRSAELLFGPTNQVELVRRALDTLPCGGTTPLGMGLELAHVVLRRAATRESGRRPTLILVSDGRANVGSQPGYAAVLAEVEAAARTLAATEGLSIVFLDTTEDGKNDAPARSLVELLGARRIGLAEVAAAGADPAVALSRMLGARRR